MYEWEVHTMNMKKQNWLGGKNQNSSKDYKLHPQGQNKGIYKTTQHVRHFDFDFILLVQGLQITTKQGRRALGLSK